VEAVTIHDLRPLSGGQVLAVDLIDILRLCESDVLLSSWRLRNVDCAGDLADEFMRLGESEATVNGQELVRLASGVYQVIEGDFEAYRPVKRHSGWWCGPSTVPCMWSSPRTRICWRG
jgi:hypothetical protein